MGLAASQAYLLSITSRLASNELRSQQINNAKMRLAAQSSQASQAYLDALNEANLMISNYDIEGNAQTMALSLNSLTAYSPYNNQYALVNNAGQMLVSESQAAAFEKSGRNLNEFLKLNGLEYDTTYFDQFETLAINSLYPESLKEVDTDTLKEWYKSYDAFMNSSEMQDYETMATEVANDYENVQKVFDPVMRKVISQNYPVKAVSVSNDKGQLEYTYDIASNEQHIGLLSGKSAFSLYTNKNDINSVKYNYYLDLLSSTRSILEQVSGKTLNDVDFEKYKLKENYGTYIDSDHNPSAIQVDKECIRDLYFLDNEGNQTDALIYEYEYDENGKIKIDSDGCAIYAKDEDGEYVLASGVFNVPSEYKVDWNTTEYEVSEDGVEIPLNGDCIKTECNIWDNGNEDKYFESREYETYEITTKDAIDPKLYKSRTRNDDGSYTYQMYVMDPSGQYKVPKIYDYPVENAQTNLDLGVTYVISEQVELEAGNNEAGYQVIDDGNKRTYYFNSWKIDTEFRADKDELGNEIIDSNGKPVGNYYVVSYETKTRADYRDKDVEGPTGNDLGVGLLMRMGVTIYSPNKWRKRKQEVPYASQSADYLNMTYTDKEGNTCYSFYDEKGDPITDNHSVTIESFLSGMNLAMFDSTDVWRFNPDANQPQRYLRWHTSNWIANNCKDPIVFSNIKFEDDKVTYDICVPKEQKTDTFDEIFTNLFNDYVTELLAEVNSSCVISAYEKDKADDKNNDGKTEDLRDDDPNAYDKVLNAMKNVKINIDGEAKTAAEITDDYIASRDAYLEKFFETDKMVTINGEEMTLKDALTINCKDGLGDITNIDGLLKKLAELGFDEDVLSFAGKSVVRCWILDCMMDKYGTPKYAWVDKNDDSHDSNAEVKAQWLTNLFNRMMKGYKVIEDGLASSPEWISFALKSGIATIEQVNDVNSWKAMDYKACTAISEESDNSALVSKAEAEYNRAMNDIKNKEQIFDLQLRNIETEHSIIQKEYDTVKKVMKDNIERTIITG